MSIKEPRDLKVKIGSPGEVLWTQVKETTLVEIKNGENALTIQKGILELAERKIKLEKQTFK